LEINSEAEQFSMKISRKQIKETLKEQGIENTLLVRKGTLTTKQKRFAESIALGETGSQSYRIAYSPPTANNKTIGNDAYKLKQDPRIVREIEAYSLAIESSKYRTSEAMRGLVLQSLVAVLIDPNSKPSDKIQAAKVLGTVTEVAAFTARKEITTINGSSATIKAKIMAELKAILLGSGQDITDIVGIDNSLMDELNSKVVESIDLSQEEMVESGKMVSIDGFEEGTVPQPPRIEENEVASMEHIIPLKQSHSNSDTPPLLQPQNTPPYEK
jgi:hypothetical protein